LISGLEKLAEAQR
jgi:dynein heavy chain 2